MAAFLARPATAPASSGPSYEVTDCGNSNMKVVVRIRPENETEIRSNYQGVTKVLDEHVLVFDPIPDYIPAFQEPFLSLNHKRRPLLSKKHKDLRFAFDRVFDETSTQVDVFEHTTKSIIDGVLDGINCSVFAYGSTGAGKTYTMLGNLENPGVMFLTMMELYRRINEIKDEKTCQVTVSYCEVYNETIRDLLVSSGPLDLREDTQKGLVVNKLTRHQPKTANDILSMLEIGNRNRTQHPTDANATSSRSHAVFQVYIHQKARTAGLSAQVTCAKMSLIDLAGSERATVTTNRGMRLREGANINKSLLALGNCINALADNKGKLVHVPYRNSKLTRLLKDSLGGNCRTVMIANVSPSGLSYEDTYNTLKYADRAKQIKTKLVRNVLTVDFHLTKYRTIVQDLQKEIAELKSKLEIKTPKQQVFDPAEATRLQGLLQSVYGERSRLRKHMADLDASERDTLLKVCRKERELQRIDALTGNGAKKTKVGYRLETLRHHVTEIQRQKQTVHEYLFSNNESIGRIQAEVNMACNSNTALRQLMEAVTEAKKLEAENAHQWKQTKHLLKYIKNQEKEVGRNERILVLSLELVRRQHAMLRASNALTPNLHQTYDTLVRLAEGDKGVAWADQSMESLHDVSLAESQQALYESFLVHASPARRNINPCGANSPSIAASLGILTTTTTSTQATASSNEVSSPASQISKLAHPLSERKSKMGTPVALSPLLIHSSSLPKRDTPIRIPNKPRRPTPADDSSSSTCSTYMTRFNTVLNATNTKSSPIASHLVRSKSNLSSGSSLTKDTQPLPVGQPSAKQGSISQPGLPYLAQPSQTIGTNSIDSARSENTYTASFPNQRSAQVFNAFEDNFVSPKAQLRTPVRSTMLKRSPLLQNLPDYVLQPTPLTPASSSAALLCRPMHSPVPTFTGSHTSIPSQLQGERSSFVPISHMRANHSGTVVSSGLGGASSHISLSNSKPKAACEENKSSTLRNSSSSVAFTPISFAQRTSAFNPVPQRMTQPPNPNPSAFNHVPHKALNGHITTTQQPKPNPFTFSLVPQKGPMSPGGRTPTTHSHYQHVMLGQGETGMSLEPGLACASEDYKRHSSVASMPSSQRSSTDTLYNHKRQESAEMVPVSVACSHPSGVSVVCEHRKQPSSEQSSTLCNQKRKRLPDALCKHRKEHSTEIDRQRGVLDTELNSTFTVESGKSRIQSAPVVTAGSKHPMSVFSVTSSNPLAQLHVNSPKALEERSRGGEEKKLPSYLQMTKSASSKRVLRAQNKENQSSLNGKVLSKSKHKHQVHSTRSASIKAPSFAPQLVW